MPRCISKFKSSSQHKQLWKLLNIPYPNKTFVKHNQYVKHNQFPTYFTEPIIDDIPADMSKYTYARKVRIFPDKQQKALFQKCFGTHRYIYNKTLETIQKQDKLKLSFYYLRSQVMKSDKLMEKTNDPELWLSDIPYDTRQLAIKNCISSFKSSLALKKNGKVKQFNHKFLSRKKPVQVFHADSYSLKLDKNNIFVRRLKGCKFRMTNKGQRWFNRNVKQVNHDFIIMKENKRYYLCLTFQKTKELNASQGDSVFLDPGVRTFQTFYSPGLKDDHDGSSGKIGDKFINKLRKLNNKIDNLTSLSTKASTKTKKHIKDRCSTLRTKIKNKITDLHWQSANYLCKTYQNVFLPSFDTKQMVNRTKRNISKLTVRSMLNLSHYKFKQRLIHMGNRMNRNIIICREDYTSKICSNCGNIKSNLGGKKVYKCELCDHKIDRDLNGAYNICVRQLMSFT